MLEYGLLCMIESRKDRVEFVLGVIKERNPRIIAVDGPCASGKTTLVTDLRERLSISVISMDDFFLPPELRTPERFTEKGGNVHYERFIEEVLTPLSEGKAFTYRCFSCRTCTYEGEVHIPSDGLVVVEGSYAFNPHFPAYWDVSFLLSIDPAEQIRRLSLRSPEKLDMFISRWIPLENEYFEACNIAGRATYIL